MIGRETNPNGRGVWDAVLDESSPWGALVVGPREALYDLEWAVPDGVDLRVVRGYFCRTDQDLFREWSAALQFPWYFGMNWDAFNECINDLEWLRSERLVVVVSALESVLAEPERPDRFPDRFEHTFLRILCAAARTPGAPPTPARGNVEGLPFVRFVLHCETAAAANEPRQAALDLPRFAIVERKVPRKPLLEP